MIHSVIKLQNTDNFFVIEMQRKREATSLMARSQKHFIHRQPPPPNQSKLSQHWAQRRPTPNHWRDVVRHLRTMVSASWTISQKY